MKAVERIQSVAELVKFYEAQKNWNKENAIAFLDKKYELCEKFGFECLDDFEGFDDDGFGDWQEFSQSGGDTFWDNMPYSWEEWIGGDINKQNFILTTKKPKGSYGVCNERLLNKFLRRYGLEVDDGRIRELGESLLNWDESRWQYRKKRKKAGMRQ